jgi:hypothetical protein
MLAGVPSDYLVGLEAAPTADANISGAEAILSARAAYLGGSLTLRQSVLGRFDDRALDATTRDRLVWLITFATAEAHRPAFVSGPSGRDTSCDWAYHYGGISALVDAETGETLGVRGTTGAYYDPSLPPTYESAANSDREYCERLPDHDT